MNPIKIIEAKTKNKRVSVYFYEKNDEHFFKIVTKKLIDFDKREILYVYNTYTVETFLVISEVMSGILGDWEVKKLINKYRNFSKYKANTNIDYDKKCIKKNYKRIN